MTTKNFLTSLVPSVAAAALGSVATASGTKSAWYTSLKKPSIQPPAAVFPVAWTALYTDVVVASTVAQNRMDEQERTAYRRALALNMALNAGWCWTFFKAGKLKLSIGVAGALAASSWDLVRRAEPASPAAAAALSAYGAWTSFATLLSAAIDRENPGR